MAANVNIFNCIFGCDLEILSMMSVPNFNINPSLPHSELSHLLPRKSWFQQDPMAKTGSNKPLVREDESVFTTPPHSNHPHKQQVLLWALPSETPCLLSITPMKNMKFSRIIFTCIQIIKNLKKTLLHADASPASHSNMTASICLKQAEAFQGFLKASQIP